MPEARIAARNLSVGYGKETVVAGLDFTLEAGETLALVGVNGSGKSTLLKTMAGLIPAISGVLEVLGGAPRSQPGRVAYLGQFHPTGMTLPLRASDVVRMGRFSSLGLFGKFAKEDEEAVEEAMADMDVVRFADQPLNRLSGGQRQRVFIAQALARRADLLLLDEPASSLDAQAVETYRDLVRAAARRGAVAVIATHDIDEAASCDRAMLLAHRVVAYGPSAAVLNPTALLETFGIVGRYREGGLVAVGREHDHCHDDGE